MSTLIPQNPVTQEDLAEWYKLKVEIAKVNPLKAKEMLLRNKIFSGLFPKPREGVNSHELPDGFVVKGTYKVQRDVDLAVFKASADRFQEEGISPENLVRYKPELAVTAYKLLTEEQMAIFDECLVIKPSAPELEIVAPKVAKAPAGETTGG